jgi:hypothetical protein
MVAVEAGGAQAADGSPLGHADGPVAIRQRGRPGSASAAVLLAAGREVWAVAVSWVVVGPGPVPGRR